MIKGIKICGVSDLETLQFILNHKSPPEFVGFITNYKKSHRYIDLENLKNLINVDKKNIKFVNVLVSPTEDELFKMKNLNFDYLQLYNVDPDKTAKIKKNLNIKIISSITIEKKIDVEEYRKYTDISEIILFDSKGYHKSKSFDHNLLKPVPDTFKKMIAGNIQIEDIPNFKNTNYIVDMSGALENSEGKKDLKKIDKLLNLVANI